MKKKEWIEYIFNICTAVSLKSKDPSTKVGCVIVGKRNQILSTGYNGFCRGIKDNVKDVPHRYNRPEKYLWTEHAERNAIYNSAAHGVKLMDSTIFVYGLPPCVDCARAIIQSGIKEVYSLIPSEESFGRWKENIDVSNSMFAESGVKFYLFDKNLEKIL